MGSLIPPAVRVLVVDDEPTLRQMLEILIRRQGFEVVAVPGYVAAQAALTQAPQPFPLVITDLVMPDGSGLDVLAAAKQRDPATEVILMTAHSTIDNAIRAIRSGASNFVTKPFDPGQLSAMIEQALQKHDLVTENARLKAQVDGRSRAGAVGKSPAMRKVFDLIGRVADTKATILITGESGTGKERVARAIHDASSRANAPFLVVNCGALPESLMESELFGHERGAFTGAVGKSNGIFREAENGTVLLDEVGELPASLQVKLLRVLQERKVRPVGGAQEVPIDVRILAATNRDVEEDVRRGQFRQDLYYRLNVIRVELPPLRDRREDIPALVEQFIANFALEMRKDVHGLTPDALRAIERYLFPGNVRELENIIERAVALAGARSIGLGDLPQEVSGMSAAQTQGLLSLPDEGCNLDEVVGEVERRLILQALDKTGGIRKSAASLLGITFRSLRYRLAKHGLGDDGDAELEA
jgi:two-component system, NtrC family, response regulator PilR